MELKERLAYFKNELKLIGSKSVKDFVKECIKQTPDYVFENCPSSSSGKYHPIEELGADGTILHTRKVAIIAYEYSRALACDNNKDVIVAAAVLHDLAKQGLQSNGHTVKDHPQIMAEFMKNIYLNKFTDTLSQKDFDIMYNSVFNHYGPWTDKRYVKNMSDYSLEELCVYLADYISSKRFVHIDLVK